MRWLRARRAHTVLAIIAASIVLRAVFLSELAFSPAVTLHTWNESDMNYFVNWGQEIAAGDLLSRRVKPPIHGWHRKVAEYFFLEYPEARVALSHGEASHGAAVPAQRLWDRWCGGGRFYQNPLYPYLAAAVIRFFGDNVLWVIAGQMLLGVARNLLIYFLARRLFGDLAAIFAAAASILYGPLLFYEAVLLRSTVIGLISLVLAVMLERSKRIDRTTVWATAGLVLGVALTAKDQFVFVGIGAMVLLFVRNRRHLRSAGRKALALAVGVFIGFSPVIARNIAVGVAPTITATGGPPTFVAANSPGADLHTWDLRYVPRIIEENDNRLLGSMVATIGAHSSLGDFLRLVATRVVATWHWYEEPNNANYYFYEGFSGVLRALPVNFGWIAPLGLLGLALALRRWRRCEALYWVVAANLSVIVLISVFARFRLPLAVALLPFAGFAASRIVTWALTRNWSRLAASLFLLVPLTLWSLSARPEDSSRVRPVDVLVAYDHYYGPMIRGAQTSGQHAVAADLMLEFLEAEPREVSALGFDQPARGSAQVDLARVYERKYATAARLLHDAGRGEAANEAIERSRELAHASNEGIQQ